MMLNVDLPPSGVAAVAISVLLHILAVVSLAVRMSKRKSRHEAGRRSDWLIFLGWAMSLANTVVLWHELGVANRPTGYRGNLENDKSVRSFLLTLYVSQLFYTLSNGAVKASIAYFLTEVFRFSDVGREGLRLVLGVTACWTVAFSFAGLFQCAPPSKAWEPLKRGSCTDYDALFISQRCISLALDVTLLLIPFNTVCYTPFLKRNQVFLVSSFSLMFFICASTVYWIIRAATRIVAYVDVDDYQAFLWPIIELNARVLYANSPFFFAVFHPDQLPLGRRGNRRI